MFFNNTNGYGDAGEHIVQIAKQINDNGTFFPVWGTCLGMELLVLKMSNNTETRSDCKARSISLPLEFKTGMVADLILYLNQANFHCISSQTLSRAACLLGSLMIWKRCWSKRM